MTLLPGLAVAGATPDPVTVVVLPYDPEALRDSLARAHGVPRPSFSALEARLRAYQAPAPADTGPVAATWRATRDSVRRLSDSLLSASAAGRHSAAYRTAYARFRALYQRFARRTAARDAALRDALADTRALAVAATRAADSLRRWERGAWADFASAARAARLAAGRDTLVVTMVAGTPVDLVLAPGAWWITARAPVAGNPFLELQWHAALVTSGLPFRVPLHATDADRVWRH